MNAGKLRLLGVAIAVALAITAVSAQAVAAVEHTFFATSAPLELTGEQTGLNVFKAGPAEVKCTTATPVGTISEETADEISLEFTLGGCKLGSLAVEVVNEGCQLAVDSDTTVDPKTSEESAAGKLVCEPGKVLKVSGGGCVVDIGTQGPLHGTRFSNVGSAPREEVSVESHVTGVEYNATTSFCGLIGISKGVHNDGTLAINARVRGYGAGQTHDEAHQVGIGIETP
jgi:hypothetical protein